MALHQLKVKSIIKETSNTKSFILERVGHPPLYKPGQFLTLLLPKSSSVRRSYSLSSHPILDTTLKITVKRIANGEFSRWLFDDSRQNDIIETIGASGFFTLPENLSDDHHLIFLAAGSGITPVMSLIKEALYFRKQNVTLIYSNHSEADTIFYRELIALQTKFAPRFAIEFLFSTSQDLLRARLGKALLTHFINAYIKDKSKALVYLCGPSDYMQMAAIVLLTEGIAAENIRTENFSTEKPKSKNLPPDTNEHQVTIHYDGKTWTFPVKYPNTILQTAKLHAIDLPYSCEAGRCGTCAATCQKGQVWMSRNEVLLDKEMDKGRVLTCTGYPIKGDVELIVNN
jgi:ferredoxin-NADP reductase